MSKMRDLINIVEDKNTTNESLLTASLVAIPVTLMLRSKHMARRMGEARQCYQVEKLTIEQTVHRLWPHVKNPKKIEQLGERVKAWLMEMRVNLRPGDESKKHVAADQKWKLFTDVEGGQSIAEINNLKNSAEENKSA